MGLQPLHGSLWAQNVRTKVPSGQAALRSQQVGAVLKALGEDASRLGSYLGSERILLFKTIDQVEAKLRSDGGNDLANAIAETKETLSGDALQLWNRFSGEQSISLDEISPAFLEDDPKSLADAMIGLAERLRKRKLDGTAWTLAKLASEYPNTNTQERAKEILDHIEGKRSSLEYVISDLFDHGGTSMVVDLVALIPAVGLGRTAWLAKKSLWFRVMAGGLIHWGTTKAVKFATGYTGKILPDSPKEFFEEFASSTLQASLALFLSNRNWMWGRSSTVTEVTTVPRLGIRGRFISGTRYLGKGIWWSTKTIAKLGLIGGLDLGLVQLPLHLSRVHDMTPQGLPSWAWKNTRLAVAQTYGARRLFRDFQNKVDNQKGDAQTLPLVDLKTFLTDLDPQLDPKKDKIKYDRVWNILVKAAAAGHLNLSTRRWILNKKSQGNLPSVNQTFKREDIDIPLRLEKEKSDVSLCIPDSEDFPCRNPPQDP